MADNDSKHCTWFMALLLQARWGWLACAGLPGDDSQALGAGARYTGRPTITYMPKTGEKFLRSLLEPVAAATLLALIGAGYNPEMQKEIGEILDLNPGRSEFRVVSSPFAMEDDVLAAQTRSILQRLVAVIARFPLQVWMRRSTS